MHAVSVGEVLSVPALIRALKTKFPGRPFYVSCSTIAGRALADQRLSDLTAGIFYVPFDYPWMIRRVLRRVRPACLIVLETEIWPNLWREVRRFGASLYVANGRISDRTWPRYRRLRRFFQAVLTIPNRILTQSDEDTRRYRALGAVNAATGGNLKYDILPPKEVPADIADWAGNAPLFIAASTMPPDEDQQVIDAFARLPPATRMILAPRKPERFDETAQRLEAAGVDFVRRSALNRPARVLLLDSMGELSSLFALPSVVFIGGSLVAWGGHNLLEPAVFGRPIVCGPHMQNFQAMFADFQAAGAVRVVRNSTELADAVEDLLADPGLLGVHAHEQAELKRGATLRVAETISMGAPLTHKPFRWFWQILSGFWTLGVRLDRAFTTRRRLARPVVSVGGLAMGGSGKTPVVLWLAGELSRRGIRAGILTRGYRREDKSPAVFSPGEAAPLALTGDEAQLFLRAGTAHVGVGADRYLTGRMLEKDVDVFLLDDGFQHWALDRDLDLVVLDPLDPYAGGGVFPAGWLREDFSALSRADYVIEPEKIVENPPPPGRYSAFCGIGNPKSFRRTLDELGVGILEWREFPDHHSYSLQDFEGLPPPLLTTEKDAVNLPAGAPDVYVVKIRVEVENGQVILERICSLIQKG